MPLLRQPTAISLASQTILKPSIRSKNRADSQNAEEEKALVVVGMAEKAREFTQKGGEIYHGNLAEEAKQHH